jgi:hypothetical protein
MKKKKAKITFHKIDFGHFGSVLDALPRFTLRDEV